MKRSKRLFPLCLPIIFLVLLCVLFTGCQSTDKTDSTMQTGGLQQAQFEYIENTNQTKVTWPTTLYNNTIYNISGFSVKLDFYGNSGFVTEESFDFTKSIKHGTEYSVSLNVYVDGNVNRVDYVSWSAEYNSFWDTYKTWIIVMIVLACVGAAIYIIVMIVADLDLDEAFDDIIDFIEDHIWLPFAIGVPLVGVSLWRIIVSSWVPTLIVLGGVVAFILIALLAHLIKYIVEEADFGFFSLPHISLGSSRSSAGAKRSKNINYATDDEDNFFDPYVESVDDYIDDKDTLMLFTVSQLKDYCRDNEITGFSSLTKAELVDLIAATGDEKSSPKKGNKPDKKSPRSNISFDDIAGLEEAKNAFREKVVYAFSHKELYEKYGKKVGGGLLLYGLPGTGKTMFAEAASNETDSLFIPIKCSDIKSKWYGESEANVKNIFAKARKAKKAIIFFDEFEAIGAKRTDDESNGNNDLVPQILAEMQGVGSNNDNCVIMVIAATNKPWSIDSAFLRPGRFDEKIYIPLPDLAARKKLFELKLKSIPQTDLDYDYLAKITDGFNGADIGGFCDKLKMLAINKSIATNSEYPITMQEVAQIEGTVKSSVSDEDISRLIEFKERYG